MRHSLSPVVSAIVIMCIYIRSSFKQSLNALVVFLGAGAVFTRNVIVAIVSNHIDMSPSRYQQFHNLGVAVPSCIHKYSFIEVCRHLHVDSCC